MFDLTAITSIKMLSYLYVAVLWGVGLVVAKRIRRFAELHMNHHVSKHLGHLLSRFIFYLILLAFLISGLRHLGFHLSVLLGAAGILTVGLSFASQTAASNLISGIFLLFEQPFKVGDMLELKEATGTVESLDLMSTKLRTLDNKCLRIPNESLMKSQIINLNHYAERRIELLINVTYETDLALAEALLAAIAAEISLPHPEHAPKVFVNAFREAAIELRLLTWAETSQVSMIKSQLYETIKLKFAEHNISLAYTPQK